MAKDDYETITPTIGALIVREYNDVPSNFRSESTLGKVMSTYKIPRYLRYRHPQTDPLYTRSWLAKGSVDRRKNTC